MEQLLISIKGIKNDGTKFEEIFEDDGAIAEAINYLEELELEEENEDE